jgi:mannose-1-phosphate guanylyltransferase
MNKKYYCVIMAGGAGERFWPVSKNACPKQFLDVLGCGTTLIQQTFQRLSTLFEPQNMLIVINKQYLPLVREQVPEIPEENILCEPTRRNTAPCIAYACNKIAARQPDAVILVAPSDHVILQENVFANTIRLALQTAEKKEWLLTLGIKPLRPETGYGYIKFRENHPSIPNNGIYKVSTFTEKPNAEIAQQFIQSGDYLWNSGIFIWSAPAILNALNQFLPEVEELFHPKDIPYYTDKEKDAIKLTYSKCQSISIDYGIMEKANNVYVIKSEFGWSDLGTWGSLFAFLPKNEQENAIIGNNVMTYDSSNNLIQIPKEKLVVVQGLDGFIVVENDNILLICKKDEEKRQREIINDIKLKKGEQYM